MASPYKVLYSMGILFQDGKRKGLQLQILYNMVQHRQTTVHTSTPHALYTDSTLRSLLYAVWMHRKRTRSMVACNDRTAATPPPPHQHQHQHQHQHRHGHRQYHGSSLAPAPARTYTAPAHGPGHVHVQHDSSTPYSSTPWYSQHASITYRAPPHVESQVWLVTGGGRRRRSER